MHVYLDPVPRSVIRAQVESNLADASGLFVVHHGEQPIWVIAETHDVLARCVKGEDRCRVQLCGYRFFICNVPSL